MCPQCRVAPKVSAYAVFPNFDWSIVCSGPCGRFGPVFGSRLCEKIQGWNRVACLRALAWHYFQLSYSKCPPLEANKLYLFKTLDGDTLGVRGGDDAPARGWAYAVMPHIGESESTQL